MSTRLTTATANASLWGIAVASTSTRAASRAPAPAGASTKRKPAIHATVYPPTASSQSRSAPGAIPRAISQVLVPKQSHVTSDHHAAVASAAGARRSGFPGRRASRRPMPSRRFSTGGASTAEPSGTASSSHQYARSVSAADSARVTAVRTTPTSIPMTNAARAARALRDLGTPWSRPSSACTSTGQMLPGRYFPSWASR